MLFCGGRICIRLYTNRIFNLRRAAFHSANETTDDSCSRSSSGSRNIVKGPFPDVNIPDVLVHEYLWQHIDKWHDKIAVECLETRRKYTYSELKQRCDNLSGYLHTLPLQKGDVIAIILPNVPEYFIALLGAMQAGVVITTINPLYTSDEMKRQLKDSKAKLVITMNELYPTVRTAIESSHVSVISVAHREQEATYPECVKFEEVAARRWTPKAFASGTEDVVLLPYSSGTTGLPKGVQLTHRNLVANYVQTSIPQFRVNTDTQGSNQDVVPIMLPMFHLYGLGVIALPLLAKGVKFVTMPRFTVEMFAKTLHEEKPSILYVVPPMVLMLLNNPLLKLGELSSTRTLISAAAPLGAADINRFRERTGGRINLLQLYGMTETSPVTHTQTSVVAGGVKIGGSGFLVPNTECKIVSADQEDDQDLGDADGLGPDESGEMLIKGPQVMKGYLNNPDANRRTLIADGWLRTGDIAHYDGDNHFFVTDRLKELIKVKGFQVAPAELEEVLRDHPDIGDAAVIGVPDCKSGEVPKAFVVFKKDSRTTVRDIHEYMESRVVYYKQLRGGIVVLNEIPKTQSGKIMRRLLKDY